MNGIISLIKAGSILSKQGSLLKELNITVSVLSRNCTPGRISGSTCLPRTVKQAHLFVCQGSRTNRLSYAAGAFISIAGHRCCGVVVAGHAGGADARADR
ncbi:hypothetical protein [Bradyrhizobium sp. CCBAU 051011]|uniref:hypothetical protein n=1 Tax=Bradyrhizobium sp. CCBAU 051011 TaxID=858422 RepID=UPI001FED382D|nr:hypothetical protein [Bradyrhizobium sp. CCBAU 051011]